MLKILIVEDEKPISDLIKLSLSSEGYACTCVYDGIEAANIIEKEHFDLILLDVMLPGANGYELMEYIRPLEIPVIFISAKADLNDRVHGLHLGADDYITKPFEIIELQARVESVLRRYHKLDRYMMLGDITIDTQSMTVKKCGRDITLTKKEFDLLLLFFRNPNIALYRSTIYERVWECDYMGDSRTVDLHVQRLRKKIGWEDKIQTIYKVGYRLNI